MVKLISNFKVLDCNKDFACGHMQTLEMQVVFVIFPKNNKGIRLQTFAIKTDLAFLKLAPSLSYSGASFLQ